MLIRPSVLPDEMDRGYLGRVMRLNGIPEKKVALEMLSAWVGDIETQRLRTATTTMLSRVANLSLADFVNQHTTLPWRRAITPFNPDLAHGCEASESIQYISGFRLARDGAFLCADCIAADQATLGFSYWRREHQFPGRYQCSRHGATLRQLTNEWAFVDSPAAHLDHSGPVDAELAHQSVSDSNVIQFLAVGRMLMERTQPLKVISALNALKDRARSQFLQVHGGDVLRPLLSDKIVHAFPARWLKEVFPGIAKKRQGELLHRLDGVLYLNNAASSVEVYLLAAVILFNSAEEAIGALLAEEGCPSERNTRDIKPAPAEDDLRRTYIEAFGRHSSVSTQCSASQFVVSCRLKSMGLPNLVRGRSKKNFREAAAAFYLEKRSIIESAAQGGIEISEFEEMIRQSSPALVTALREWHGKQRCDASRSDLPGDEQDIQNGEQQAAPLAA